jgi:subtilisin family serine protease
MKKSVPVVVGLFVVAALAIIWVQRDVTDDPPPDQAPIRALLQGSSAPQLRELVEATGGTITHDLHIIDAVGALVTPSQLQELERSPLVSRHIVDLSVQDPEIEEDEPACDVGGALELGVRPRTISWTLHNKRSHAAVLRRLELAWPALLGPVSSITLAGSPLTFDDAGSEPGSLDLVPGEQSVEIPPDSKSELAVVFGREPGGDFLQQRDFSIRAEFAGDCETSLVPGYARNHEDSYFPSVAGADALHRHGVTGKGVTIAIIDSGLWEHEALITNTAGERRIVARYDAIEDVRDREVFDESGHGTHITSVLAHSDEVTLDGQPTGSFKGIAPDAGIVAVKAFNVEGQGDYLDLVRAIQFVVDNRQALDIRVLNLSFAARPRWHYWLDPINQAVMQAWAAGITVVAAAGNEGPDPMSIGSPGNLPYVITVGAVTDSWTTDTRDDDYIPDFSSRGPTPDAHLKPDLVAPGGHMTGITRPGSTLLRDNPEYQLVSGEYVLTGTSQASAVVAGMAALLLQLEPGLSPDDIKCMLMSSAEPAINADGSLAYSPFQQGSGVVTVTRALTLGERGCGNRGLDIAADIAGSEHFTGPAVVDDAGQVSLPGLEQVFKGGESEKGLSSTRKWGVKEHIERDGYQWGAIPRHRESPFDWEAIYLREKQIMEQLAADGVQAAPPE